MKKTIFPILLCMLCMCNCAKKQDDMADTRLKMIIGTYTSTGSTGIYVCSIDTLSGEFVILDSARQENPSFLSLSSDNKFLYAVTENRDSSAGATSYSLTDGKLARLNSIDALGASPCNISNNGKEIATAEYGGGSMTRYSLNSDGSIGSMIQHIDFKGHSVDRKAQLAPHIHSVQYNPDGNVYITDLGCDNIYVLHDSCIVDTIKMEPNFGPRHIVFNKNNDIMYAIGELSGKVCVLKRENERFVPVQYLFSDMTEGINGKGSADIHLSNDGKFLYTSNRLKNDGIAVFAVLPDGKLEMNGYTKTGVHPRNFAITPDDNWVVVACRDSNTIEFYNRDSESGMLSAKASLTISSIKKPVFVSFF